ncbi:hypothetical protein GH810_16820 [Acetobacterium paludosum]|uniref:Cell envelope-related transcriptional attenuator domain-containing protein n=1 Tax=Acetobacterium paludosum TaxID=52693 RepID=A0A923HWU1_9FIRM|nr:LCP family protein [Acetobacterium paludosum]MBC3889964.1 hypothetical protein [Acetobacterium paludosum]
MMKNRKRLLIPLTCILLIVAFTIYGFINSNMNLTNGSTSSEQSQGANEGSDITLNDNSESSIKDVLDQNNEELFKMIDTRKTVTFAIYGIDDKYTEEGRSDIIMVIKYDPSLKKMVIASIPRDLRIDIPGYGIGKINAAFAYGGSELADQVIEELLGIKLDFSIKLNFDTFSKIIDSVGGVRINAKKDFYNGDNLVIKEGNQVLNGKNALFYVRFRSDSDVDYGRIGRQQEVVISLMEYLKSTSLKEKIKLVGTYYNNGIETDAKLAKITDYIKMSNADENITYENYRLQTYSEVIDGLWYELYNQEDLDTIKNLFSNKEEMNLENWK